MSQLGCTLTCEPLDTCGNLVQACTSCICCAVAVWHSSVSDTQLSKSVSETLHVYLRKAPLGPSAAQC